MKSNLFRVICKHGVRILLLLLLAVGFTIASLVATICWPVSEHDSRDMALSMIHFYNQPHPSGIFIEDFPASLLQRDRQYCRRGPSCDVHPGYMCLEYYYRRFGIDYEVDFFLMNRRPDEPPFPTQRLHPNDPVWTLTPEIKFWNPLKSDWFYSIERSVSITNSP